MINWKIPCFSLLELEYVSEYFIIGIIKGDVCVIDKEYIVNIIFFDIGFQTALPISRIDDMNGFIVV